MRQEGVSPRDEKAPDNEQQQNPFKITQQRYKSIFGVMLLVSNICLSNFYFGYIIIYMNVIDFQTIINNYNITMDKSIAQGVLTFCVPIGGLLGSYLSSYFINNLSRRKSILIINYAAITIGLLVFFKNLQFYMLMRFFQGILAGLYSAMVPLLVKEITPFELSGRFGVFPQLFIVLGVFSSCFLYFILSEIYSDPEGQQFWRIIFGFPLIILSIQTFALYKVYPFQTPIYLIEHKQETQALRLIAFIYKPEFVDDVFKEIKSSAQIPETVEMQEVNQVQVKKSSNQSLKITTIVAIHLSLLQQFVGISAVATYAGSIAEGNLTSFKPVLPSIINFQQVITTIMSSFLLNRFGRKTILQFGTIWSAITNILITIGFLIENSSPSLSITLILLGLFLFMANFGLSLGPIVWMYIPEIVKPNILPYSTLVNWAGSALTILFFPIIKKQLPNENPALMFAFFAIWSSVSYIVNRKYLIETKDKTEGQIYQEYRKLEHKVFQ